MFQIMSVFSHRLMRVASMKMQRIKPNPHPSTLTRARVLVALAKAQAARLTQ
jgi:hypothetical protein